MALGLPVDPLHGVSLRVRLRLRHARYEASTARADIIIPSTEDRCASNRPAQAGKAVARRALRLFLPEHSGAKCTVTFGIWYNNNDPSLQPLHGFLLAPEMVMAYDAIVIGGGLAGCSAAAQLARRGHQVLLL